MAIGLENLYSRSNWAFGIEGEGFTRGDVLRHAGANPAAELGAEVGAR